MGDRGGTSGHRDFFVCGADNATDRVWAAWIAWTLEAAQRAPAAGSDSLSPEPFTTFLELWDSVGGDNIARRVDEGLRRSRRVLVVLSRTLLAQTAGTSQATWLAAWRKDPDGAARQVLPVRVDDCDPDGLLGGIPRRPLHPVLTPVRQLVSP
ncbi:hypothetical protein FRACA_1240002 [Frankia canadensis]|uniref:TIR domain-containing protein n=1 Tax=Frankia canadensis TaxID=1836972 RepID=A0A2I2KK91_9ACTN|nr:toll/interleukin-1 receptor domain-containing protein [Frankia canadensis]SNQ46067.1 hypothetical protein FRACA_1240002 [Frankia canadensis]SOU53357.1 hypothetical protein FRACA_1240002 [Frankia canadensis]